MKKVIAFSLFILCFSFVGTAKATSGACSSHQGVNCSAGADWDGSVICNDGNTSSSVKYSDMSECATKSTCDALLYSSGCSNEDFYTNQENYCNSLKISNMRSGLSRYGAGEAVASENACAEKLQKCREEINQYKANLVLYDKCIKDESAAKYKYLTANITAEYLVTQNKTCLNGFGQFSSYDQASNRCVCKTGFILDKNNQCSLPLISVCVANSSKVGEKCVCNQGYKTYDEGKTCGIDLEFVKNYIKLNQSKTVLATTTISKKIVYAYSEKSNLNIREKNSQNSKVIGTLKKKTKYEIVDLSNKDWTKIKFGNKVGWVSKKLIVVK